VTLSFPPYRSSDRSFALTSTETPTSSTTSDSTPWTWFSFHYLILLALPALDATGLLYLSLLRVTLPTDLTSLVPIRLS